MGTITKALELLDFFSRARPEIGLGEFVRLSGRDKATVHRHLVELAANGYLEQNQITRAYRLGPALLRLSGVREATYPIRTLLRPIVAALAEEVGELAHLSLLQGMVVSPVCHADPARHGTQVHFDEAEVLPLHATSSGLAVLAFSAPTFARKVLSRPMTAYTGQTPVDPEAIAALLDEIRRTGLSRLDRAFDDEVSSQAAPIFDQAGAVIGAISVAVPSVRARPDYMRPMRAAILEAARSATRSLGGTYPTLADDMRLADPAAPPTAEHADTSARSSTSTRGMT